MPPAFTASPTSVKFFGIPIPGAEDRQKLIPGWDQEAYFKASVVCIGAGGIISHIAPTLCRKGIGKVTLLDRDAVEISNLNRQRFYIKDIGKNKALALAGNIQPECMVATEICGHALMLEEAVERRIDLSCDVAICGVDNNPARVASSRYFRALAVPVIFVAVSLSGDHGYIFVQGKTGACIACLFPDMVDCDRYPCPGTPAIGDILQAAGALAVYAVDALLMKRCCNWNYRRLTLSDGSMDASCFILKRPDCRNV
jgi:molybdopterin/thiamine biosynthesis adenylyltransferase